MDDNLLLQSMEGLCRGYEDGAYTKDGYLLYRLEIFRRRVGKGKLDEIRSLAQGFENRRMDERSEWRNLSKEGFDRDLLTVAGLEKNDVPNYIQTNFQGRESVHPHLLKNGM